MDKLHEQLAEALRRSRKVVADAVYGAAMPEDIDTLKQIDDLLAAVDAAKARETRLTETTGRAAGIAHERVQPVTAGETAQQEAAKAGGGWLPIEPTEAMNNEVLRSFYGYTEGFSASVRHCAYMAAKGVLAIAAKSLPPPPEQTE